MKAVIFGGTGLIGTRLTHYLLERGHQAVVISRSPLHRHAGAECLTWDEAEQNPARLAGADAFVNLAGETINRRWTATAKERIVRSRIEAAQRAGRLAERLPVRPSVVVSASAIGIYPPSETATYSDAAETAIASNASERAIHSAPAAHSNVPIDSASSEANEVAGGAEGGFLAEVVRQWEQAADAAYPFARVVKLRIGLVLAAEGGALPVMALPYKLFAGGPVGQGRQWMSWIHIDDLVRLIEFCLQTEAMSGPVNATAPEPCKNREFGQMLGRVLRRPHYFPVPPLLLKIALGEMSTLLTDGQRVIPQKALENGFRFRYPEPEGALRRLLIRDH